MTSEKSVSNEQRLNAAVNDITAITTRLGTANMAFLATLGQMSATAQQSTGGWVNPTNTAIADGLNRIYADINAILTKLHNENYMA